MRDFLARTRKAWVVVVVTLALPWLEKAGGALGVDLVPALDMTLEQAGASIVTALVAGLAAYIAPNRASRPAGELGGGGPMSREDMARRRPF